MNGVAPEVNSAFKCFIVVIKKMLGKEEKEENMLSSFKLLFSLLKIKKKKSI